MRGDFRQVATTECWAGAARPSLRWAMRAKRRCEAARAVHRAAVDHATLDRSCRMGDTPLPPEGGATTAPRAKAPGRNALRERMPRSSAARFDNRTGKHPYRRPLAQTALLCRDDALVGHLHFALFHRRAFPGVILGDPGHEALNFGRRQVALEFVS